MNLKQIISFIPKQILRIYNMIRQIIKKVLKMIPFVNKYAEIGSHIIMVAIISGSIGIPIAERFDDYKEEKLLEEEEENSEEEKKGFFQTVSSGLSNIGKKMGKVKDVVSEVLEDKNSEKFASVDF